MPSTVRHSRIECRLLGGGGGGEMGRARLSSAGVGLCRWRTFFGALLLALAVGTTACGSSSDSASGGSSGTETDSSEVAKEAQDVGKQENPASQITDYVEYS